MRKELVAAVAAAFVLGVSTATFLPVDAFAAGEVKKDVSACDKIKDKKKKSACRKAEAEKKKGNKEKKGKKQKKGKK